MSSNNNTVTMKFNVIDPEELKDAKDMIDATMRSEIGKADEQWEQEERDYANYINDSKPFGLETPKMQKWIDLVEQLRKPALVALLMKAWGACCHFLNRARGYEVEIESLKKEVFTYMEAPDSPIQKQYIKNVGKDILEEWGKLKGIEKILIAEVEKRKELETEVAHHKGIIKQYERITNANRESSITYTDLEAGKDDKYETTLRDQLVYNCELQEERNHLQKALKIANETIENNNITIKSQNESYAKYIQTIEKHSKKLDAATKENKRLKAALKKHQEEKKALSTDQINKSEIVKILKKSISELTSSLATRTKQYEDYKRKMKKSRRK